MPIQDKRTPYEKLQDDLLSILEEESEKSISLGSVTDRVNRMQVSAYRMNKTIREQKSVLDYLNSEIPEVSK